MDVAVLVQRFAVFSPSVIRTMILVTSVVPGTTPSVNGSCDERIAIPQASPIVMLVLPAGLSAFTLA